MDEAKAEVKLRRTIYALLVVVAGSMIAGRMATVESKTGEVPFLSANDRSRWCTISSLVDDGTYVIDRQMAYREPVRKRRVWATIDLVRHRGTDGQQHYYSSKPPLYPTILAGVYAVIKTVMGASVMDYPFMIGRWMLAVANLLPMLAYFVLMLGLIEKHGRTNYGRLLAAGTLTCGTLLVPFSISINNHLPAAICTAVALCCVLRSSGVGFWIGVVAGLAGGFAVANELPALSMACLWGVLMLWLCGARAFAGYATGAAVVAVAFFATNYIAHNSLRPPYAHRGTGAEIGTIESGGKDDLPAVDEIASRLSEAGVSFDGPLEIRETSKSELLEVWDAGSEQRFALTRADSKWSLAFWDDWYEYPGTYWQASNRSGVDKGEESRVTYAFHALIGHHGIFSLTPVWLLSLMGVVVLGRSEDRRLRFTMLAICLATAVCFAFYIARPLVDRNYGGVSCGFRWMLWFIPLWLWLMIPAADLLAKNRFAKTFGLVLLAVSVFSVVTSLDNPWQHPWIYRYWEYLGWIAY